MVALVPPGGAARRIGLAVADQVLISGGNFASGFLLAVTLEKSHFGLYVLLNVLIQGAIAIQNGLTLQPLSIHGASLDEAAFRRFLRAKIYIQGGFIVLSAFLVFAVASYWDAIRQFALPLTLAVVFFQGQDFCRRVLYTRGHIRPAMINNIVNYDLQALVLALIAWRVGLDLQTALWVIAATSLVALALGAFQLRRFVSGESDDVRAVARRNFELGKWTTASAILEQASIQSFPALVASEIGLVGTAAMGVIGQILGIAHLIPRPLQTHYLPRAVRAFDLGGEPELSRVMREATRFAAPPYVLFVGIIALAPEIILRTGYGARYAEYSEVLRLSAVGTLLHLPIYVMSLEFHARRMQPYLAVSHLVNVAILLSVGAFLIGRIGLIGAGWTVAIANGANAAWLLVAIVRARAAARRAQASSHRSPERGTTPPYTTPNARRPQPARRVAP